jgi:LCP family protein required for cell wall assembly
MSTNSQTHQWQSEAPARTPLSWGARVTLAVAFILFVAGGLLFGYIFYATLRDRMTQPLNPVEAAVSVLPSNNPSAPAANPEPSTNSNPAPSANTTKERVNILLLGIDQRESEASLPTRTDTMILLTIDPVGKTMGMLTIPRDLWVPIPGLDKGLEERINTAHFYGDVYKYPGGGPALAKKTVQYNLGVPVHYYVRVDFKSFEKIVDVLGGVTINVENAIRDNEYPDGNYGTISIYIPAGLQHMDGETALRYVRTRHADSDFGRTRRQLQFLVAMRDQALKLNILPKVPSLISQFRDSVKTDLSANEIISLARIASQIESADIKTRSIDETMITSWITPQGGDVLIPKRDEIRKVVEDLFGPVAPAATAQPQPTAPTPAPTAVQNSEARTKLQNEGARIEVLNGTNTKGLAGRAQTYLNSLGYRVINIGDAGRYDYTETVIVYYAERQYTQASLAKLFNVRPENIRLAPSARMDIDIRIILGSSAKIP